MKPYLEDRDLVLYQGDALEVLRTLPDGSVHMCVTSPPFYGLRDYACEGQIGLEETPSSWVAKLVAVFREVRRVLRADGTCWVEVGDSYAGSNRGNAASPEAYERLQGDPTVPVMAGGKRATSRLVDGFAPPPPGLKPKDLIGAPWMLAFALRADGWYLRSDIVWSKPNPMPESVTDRPTKSHSYVFLLSKSARYIFDQEAVREAVSPLSDFGKPRPDTPMPSAVGHQRPGGGNRNAKLGNGSSGDPAGRNVRSVWQIATQPYPEAHFATYPEELVRRCILAGTSERGCCPECGTPWTREVDRSFSLTQETNNPGGYEPRGDRKRGVIHSSTLGWVPSCDHYEGWPEPFTPPLIPCTVLDPFFGSGTTGLVARKHGRHTIGIELSSAYCELAARRSQQLSLLAEGR